MSVPAIDIACPNCQALPGEPCTRATDTTRRPIKWFHLARADAAAEIEPPRAPATRSEIIARALLTALQNDKQVSFIACDCGTDLEISEDTTVDQARELLEHAAFGHTSRRDIDVYRTQKLLTGYELGITLRLDALTDAEQKWREEQRDSIT